MGSVRNRSACLESSGMNGVVPAGLVAEEDLVLDSVRSAGPGKPLPHPESAKSGKTREKEREHSFLPDSPTIT